MLVCSVGVLQVERVVYKLFDVFSEVVVSECFVVGDYVGEKFYKINLR